MTGAEAEDVMGQTDTGSKQEKRYSLIRNIVHPRSKFAVAGSTELQRPFRDGKLSPGQPKQAMTVGMWDPGRFQPKPSPKHCLTPDAAAACQGQMPGDAQAPEP